MPDENDKLNHALSHIQQLDEIANAYSPPGSTRSTLLNSVDPAFDALQVAPSNTLPRDGSGHTF